MTVKNDEWLKEAIKSKYVLSYAKDVTKPPQPENTATVYFRSVFKLMYFIATNKQVHAAAKAERVQLITKKNDKSIVRRVRDRVVAVFQKGTFS